MHSSCFLLSIISALFLYCGDALNITGITETDEANTRIGNIDEDDWCPEQNEIYIAYPNPANSSTTMLYQIGNQTRVKLQIINKDKKVVRLLVDQIQAAGFHSVRWSLRDDSGNRVKNGFYRAQFFVDGEFRCHGDIQVISNN